MTGGGDAPDDTGPLRWFRWFWRSDHAGVIFAREVATSVLVVIAIGVVLFGVSGIWPPMVAVESGSMSPHMDRGDLVFVMEEHRLAPRAAHDDTGVVPHVTGQSTGYWKFGDYGDVIIYTPDGRSSGPPIIHRAMFWVDAGENWYGRANKTFVRATDCEELRNCPAPHAGFITKGDNYVTNRLYDQAMGISGPVRPSWIRGTAEVRIPWLGYVRLEFGTVRP